MIDKFLAAACGPLSGRVRVPGDKSISHRSIMLGSLAAGVTEVTGFLDGADCLATAAAFTEMGVRIDRRSATSLKIHGVGLHGLQAPTKNLDIGNSGTSIRLMSGLLAGQQFSSTLVGDASLSKRPMNRLVDPLRLMGADIQTAEGGRTPLRITPVEQLNGIDYTLPMASAQVKSCVVLAGLYANSTVTVTEPAPTRDHSERMLRGFGAEVLTEDLGAGRARITIEPEQELHAMAVDVPADISSAAFFMVAASIIPDSDIVLEHVGINPTRTGVIDILRLMGADIELQHLREVGGEPVADIRIRHAELKGIHIPEELVPLAIDEFPVLFIAATAAVGETVLTGAEELRVKESDRIQVMADGLATLGIDAKATPDGIVIQPGQITTGDVHAQGDHRIAMAFTVAAALASGEVLIHDCRHVATSFPAFLEQAQQLGLNVKAAH